MRINLNDYVKVRLTDLGRDIYYHRVDEINSFYGREFCKPTFTKEGTDGYTEFQLWKFIELYGKHIGMGKPHVIQPFEIVYGENDG